MKYIRLGKKLVGIINHNNQFVIRRNKRKHFMRKYKAYGISTKILMDLHKWGIKEIILIEETEKGENAYLTTVENWIDNGIVDKFQDLEYQNFLPLKYWKKIE